MPRRTVLGSSCSAKSALTVSARASGSATSPSRMVPGRSSATAPRVSVREPASETSAAATWPASSSSPTTLACWGRFFLRSTTPVSAEARCGLNARSGPEGPLRGESEDSGDDYQLVGQPAPVQPRGRLPALSRAIVQVLGVEAFDATEIVYVSGALTTVKRAPSCVSAGSIDR